MTVYIKSFSVALVLLIVHFFALQFLVPEFNVSKFIISYGSQIALSIVGLLIILQVEKKAKEQMGYVFLGLSSAKVIISYLIATQFLFTEAIVEKEIKFNFFIAFMIFLCLDTYFVIRLLNKK